MKAVFKLLGFLFNLGRQYNREKRRYYSSGYVAKIFALIVLPLMIVGVGACGYGTYWIFSNLQVSALFFFKGVDNWFYSWLMVIAGFVLGYITIGFALSTVASLIQNSIIAFKCASDKRKQAKADKAREVELAEGETHVEHDEEVKHNTSIGFDIFYGVMCLLLLVSSVTAVVVFFMVRF